MFIWLLLLSFNYSSYSAYLQILVYNSATFNPIILKFASYNDKLIFTLKSSIFFKQFYWYLICSSASWRRICFPTDYFYNFLNYFIIWVIWSLIFVIYCSKVEWWQSKEEGAGKIGWQEDEGRYSDEFY